MVLKKLGLLGRYFHAQPISGIVLCRQNTIVLKVLKGLCLELRQRNVQLFLIGRFTVPFVGTGHKINPVAHGGFHQNNHRLSLSAALFGFAEYFDHGSNIIPLLQYQYFPAKSYPFGV
jgi:hypothetical protein